MSSRESIRRLGLFQVRTSNHAVIAAGVRDRIFPGVCRSVLSLVGNSNAFLKYRVRTNYRRILQNHIFHKYWTEIHDVTTIWKRNVCSFIVTLNAFDVRPTCDTGDRNRERHTRHAWEGLAGMGVSPGHLPCHTWGAHRMHLRSLRNCKHSSFKW